MAPEGAMAPTSQQKRLAEIPELQEERSSPPKAKARSAAKAGAKADKAIVKATAKAVAKANKQQTDDNIALIMSKFESRNRSRRAASEGPVQIRKVAVDDDAEIVKRGRGRPPGSLGIKKRTMLAVAPP